MRSILETRHRIQNIHQGSQFCEALLSHMNARSIEKNLGTFSTMFPQEITSYSGEKARRRCF
jgi:hypothetical protein